MFKIRLRQVPSHELTFKIKLETQNLFFFLHYASFEMSFKARHNGNAPRGISTRVPSKMANNLNIIDFNNYDK